MGEYAPASDSCQAEPVILRRKNRRQQYLTSEAPRPFVLTMYKSRSKVPDLPIRHSISGGWMEALRGNFNLLQNKQVSWLSDHRVTLLLICKRIQWLIAPYSLITVTGSPGLFTRFPFHRHASHADALVTLIWNLYTTLY